MQAIVDIPNLTTSMSSEIPTDCILVIHTIYFYYSGGFHKVFINFGTVLMCLLICCLVDSKVDGEWKSRSRVCILMSIAYSSNIGGTGSLIGSGPQLAFKGILNE